MLRTRTPLGRAALVLALALWVTPAAADQTVGAACSGSGGDAAQSGNGNNVYCNGSTIQYPAYQFGSTTNSCSSTTAGQVQYTSGTLEACIATGSTYTWIPIDSGMHFIATQTASNSASLQFTNLPTSYNTLFLNCAGILMENTTSNVLLLVGEGATPTWETGAHYNNSNGITNGTDLIGGPAIFDTATIPVSLKVYIDNVGSSSLYKIATMWLMGYGNGNGANNAQNIYVTGWWDNDTNVVTGLELTGNGSNIKSATCSLYGMN